MSRDDDDGGLDLIVADEAERMGLSDAKHAYATTEFEYAWRSWKDEVHDRIQSLPIWPDAGHQRRELYEADAPYLLLMTMHGVDVGIWDGIWDHFYRDARMLRRGGIVSEFLTRELAVPFAAIEQALEEAALETGGHLPIREDDWRSSVVVHDPWHYNDGSGRYYWCREDAEAQYARMRTGRPPALEDPPEMDYPLHCPKGTHCANALVLPDGDRIGAFLNCDLDKDGRATLCAELELPTNLRRFRYELGLWAYEFQGYLKVCKIRPEYIDQRESMVESVLQTRADIDTPEGLERIARTPGHLLSDVEKRSLMRHWGLPEEPPPYYGEMPPRKPKLLSERMIKQYAATGVPIARVHKRIRHLREQRPRLREGYEYNPIRYGTFAAVFDGRAYTFRVVEAAKLSEPLEDVIELRETSEERWGSEQEERVFAEPARYATDAQRSLGGATCRYSDSLDACDEWAIFLTDDTVGIVIGAELRSMLAAARWDEIERP